MSWDNYYSKHCARFYGWLPASVEFKKRKGDKLSYLTLCDTNAIDIFMLEMEGVLERDENSALTGVTICEMEESKITEIFQNVNPPLREAIVKGKIQKLILFEDTDELREMDPDGDVRNRDLRMKLNLRRDALRLQNKFPFDIINFDPCDSLLYPERELFKSFDRIFELQKTLNEFLIFATTPITASGEILSLFERDFRQNVSEYRSIYEASESFLNTTDFNEIGDEKRKISVGFGKTLLAKLALKHNFKCSDLGIYIYENDKGNLMLSSVCEIRTSIDDVDDWYPQLIVELIKDSPSFFSFQQAQEDEKVKHHLERVISSRENIQRGFTIT